MTRADLDTCTKIAAKQYGMISLDQALRSGLSRDAVKRLSAEGIWRRVLPQTYALWAPAAGDELWRQRLMAGTLWLGEDAAISHRAGALVWEFDGVKTAPLEFSATGHRRSAEPGIIVHRVGVFSADEVSVRKRLRVTSASRTLVDLASVVEAEAVELALESAVRRGLTTIEQIGVAVSSTPRSQRGVRLIRFLLAHHPGPATGSPLETLTWRLLRGSKLPVPYRQFVIRDPAGRFVARADFAYPERMLVIEADGFGSHSGKDDFARDRARQNALVRLGWTVYRVTWQDVTSRADQVVADVRALLARGAAAVAHRRGVSADGVGVGSVRREA